MEEYVDFYVNREKKWLEDKQYTEEMYILFFNSKPDSFRKMLLENVKHYICLAIHRMEFIPKENFDFGDKVKYEELVESIFQAIKKCIIKG